MSARGAVPAFLVTGAAGHLGRIMGRMLGELGLAWRGVDRIPHDGCPAPFLVCDLSDPGATGRLRRFCRGTTHVIHLAGRITNCRSIEASYAEQFQISVLGTLNLLKALGPETGHFSFASSMTVYGVPRTLPVHESHPVEPNCVYALCKLAAERYLSAHAKSAGRRVCLLRYSSAYGPGPADGRAIQSMIARVLSGAMPIVKGDGLVQRDYIFQDDLCRVTIAAALQGASGVLNVGSGRGTASVELAYKVLDLLDAEGRPEFVEREPDGPVASSMVYDITKMRALMGDAPLTTLDEGLALTIEHCKRRQAAAASFGDSGK
jgi:UDP-glucose 4-epimerase